MKFYVFVIVVLLCFVVVSCNRADDSDTEEMSVVDTLGMFKMFVNMADEYMVTYKYEIPDAPEPSPIDENRMTYFFAPGKTRFDMFLPGMAVRTYIIGDEMTYCMEKEEVWECYHFSKGADVPMATMGGDNVIANVKEMSSHLSEMSIKKVPNRWVAKTQALCFLITLVAKQEICFSPEGVLLYMAVTADENALVIEATQYSLSVTDEDFIFPAEPKSMKELYAKQ